MKTRTFLLVACMIVVPLVAMFSHRVPAGARTAIGAFLRDCVNVARPAAVAAPAPLPQVPVRPAVERAATEPSAHRPEATPPPRVVPVAALAPEPAAVESLRALGAVAIDCRPLQGNLGHVASCRLPIDASGQLERVFQATGADAVAATDQLLRDVTTWRRGTTGARRATMRF